MPCQHLANAQTELREAHGNNNGVPVSTISLPRSQDAMTCSQTATVSNKPLMCSLSYDKKVVLSHFMGHKIHKNTVSKQNITVRTILSCKKIMSSLVLKLEKIGLIAKINIRTMLILQYKEDEKRYGVRFC